VTALARQHHDLVAPVTPASEAERGRRVEAMFDDHYDAIWRTLRRLGIPDADVDDAAQRVFVTGARRLDTIEVGHEGRYLYGIAVRVASELRRRAPSRHEVSDDDALAKIADDAPGPEEVLLESEARDALDQALAGMSDELRAVLVLVEIEGLSVADLAASLEVPVGTAASRLRRAREAFTASARRVRARLESEGAKR
jgi:RNA polymerase sigma-70 factor (ECF subfamily)